MKRKLTLLLTVLFTLFTLPVSSLTAFAADEDKVYEDGEYKIGVQALEVNSEKESAADSFLIDEATLSVDGDDIALTFDYTKDFEMDYGINWTKLEKSEPIDERETDKAFTYTFQTDEIKTTYQASMNYYVPGMRGDMADKEKGHSVDYRIVLDEDDLKKATEKEESKPEVAPEERKVGKILTEKEADAVYELEYTTESKATAGQLENPVKLLQKDNKEYIQIQINEGGAKLFRSLKFDGKEVTWNSITEGPYTIQYELQNGIQEDLDVSMVIQAGPNAMPHKDIKITFNEDSLKTIKEPESEPEPKPEQEKPEVAPEERKVGKILTEKEADAVYELEYTTESKATAGQLENPVKLLKKDNKQYIQISINERGAGFFRSLKFEDKEVTWNSITEGPYMIQFELPNGIETELDVSMVIQAGPNVMPHENIKLWFDKDSLETIKEPKPEEQKEEPKENKPETPSEKPKADEEKDNALIPDKAFEIDYTILHANGDKPSAADGFFIKPGIILEKDGISYAQFTINNGNMIKELSTEFGEVLIIKENKDGSIVVQFKVKNDYSDMKLEMKVVVPGLYGEKHDAILVLDKTSLKELNAEDYKLVASDGVNGPTVEGQEPGKPLGKDGNGDAGDNGDKGKDIDTPEKPEFGSGDENGQEVAASTKDPKNPQTGDTSSILLYTLLLIGSMVPLAVKFRRRFV